MTHWYQKSLTHTRLTGTGECERFSLLQWPVIFTHALTAKSWCRMCYPQVQQISKRLDTQVCNVRAARRPDENKENTWWEQKNHVEFITWDNWATEDIKLDHSASFGSGSIIMRHSATWLSVCWAATMWCPSCLVWICSAGPDGLLKAVPYGIPETLHSPNHNTQT